MNSPRVAASGWLILLACLAAACSPPGEERPPMSVGERLSGDTAGYLKVTEPRAFRYPADHGAHPRFKHEWWYVTGQLAGETRRFGFQLTIFRESVAPRRPDSDSHWATNQLYLAHAALTDVAGGRYLSEERFARGAVGLAGATAAPFRIWLEDWEMRGRANAGGSLQALVAASGERFGFELVISSSRPPVVHGDRGMSVKGPGGDASYYYSYTRLDARGTVRLDGESFAVTGGAWFDHEWSSSALESGQSGWDWFSLQLSGGRDLMLFRLRDERDPDRDFYSGTFVDRSGDAATLSSSQIDIEPLHYWTSDRSGVRYPVRWRLRVPDLDVDLTTEALLDDQEFAHTFRYWEGAVRVAGTLGGDRVGGQGYVELAGYTPDGRR